MRTAREQGRNEQISESCGEPIPTDPPSLTLQAWLEKLKISLVTKDKHCISKKHMEKTYSLSVLRDSEGLNLHCLG